MIGLVGAFVSCPLDRIKARISAIRWSPPVQLRRVEETLANKESYFYSK